MQRPDAPLAPSVFEVAPPPPPPPGTLPGLPAVAFPPPFGAPAPALVVVLFPAVFVSPPDGAVPPTPVPEFTPPCAAVPGASVTVIFVKLSVIDPPEAAPPFPVEAVLPTPAVPQLYENVCPELTEVRVTVLIEYAPLPPPLSALVPLDRLPPPPGYHISTTTWKALTGTVSVPDPES